jgi:hypothetical protein
VARIKWAKSDFDNYPFGDLVNFCALALQGETPSLYSASCVERSNHLISCYIH